MSELAPGSVSLEDDNPSLESLSQAPAAPDTPAATPDTPPVDPDPDGTIEGSGGVKFVPLNAVVDLRSKVRETKTALEAKEAEIAALKEKADKYDEVAGQWQAAQPVIEQLRNGTYQPAPPPQAPAGPLSPQEAIDYAKDLDLYKADGTPDVDRAQRLAARTEALAQRQAHALVQPIYQNTALAQSHANFEHAANFKAPNGVQVNRDILRQIWSMVPAELSSQPGVAGILYKVAMADTLAAGGYKAPVTAPPPPVITESLGGNTPRPELSSVDRNMMAAASIKGADYEKISAQYKPGERNSLE